MIDKPVFDLSPPIKPIAPTRTLPADSTIKLKNGDDGVFISKPINPVYRCDDQSKIDINDIITQLPYELTINDIYLVLKYINETTFCLEMKAKKEFTIHNYEKEYKKYHEKKILYNKNLESYNKSKIQFKTYIKSWLKNKIDNLSKELSDLESENND